jgi:adenine-specific DNA-methyltransferase
LIERLKVGYKKLSDIVGNEAYYGLKSGLTEAFLIDKTTRSKIVAEDPKSAHLIKPFLLGRDAKAYATGKLSVILYCWRKDLQKRALDIR